MLVQNWDQLKETSGNLFSVEKFGIRRKYMYVDVAMRKLLTEISLSLLCLYTIGLAIALIYSLYSIRKLEKN